MLLKIIDRLALGRTVLLGLPIMLLGTAIVVVGVMLPQYFIYCVIIGMTMVSFGEGISFSVLYRFALMSSEVSKGTVAAAVSVLMMFSFFVVIELIRMLYEQFHILAYGFSCLALIVLWFSFPRRALMQVLQERREAGEF